MSQPTTATLGKRDELGVRPGPLPSVSEGYQDAGLPGPAGQGVYENRGVFNVGDERQRGVDRERKQLLSGERGKQLLDKMRNQQKQGQQ